MRIAIQAVNADAPNELLLQQIITVPDEIPYPPEQDRADKRMSLAGLKTAVDWAVGEEHETIG